MKRTIVALLAGSAGLAIATPAAAQGGCTAESLQEMSNDWVAALEQGTMMTMELGEWVDYNQNFERASLGAFLDEPREIDWKLELFDTQSCQVLVEAAVTSESGAQVIATQFGSGFFGVGGFQNITTGPGDWLFDAEAFVAHAKDQDWGIVPEGERADRATLMAIANAYLDRFADPSVAVSLADDCTRIEGGSFTGDQGCAVGMPTEAGTMEFVERRYVVDVARQAVNVMGRFGPDKLGDSHTFRIEDGKIRYVHSQTNCKGIEGCGAPAA